MGEGKGGERSDQMYGDGNDGGDDTGDDDRHGHDNIVKMEMEMTRSYP